MHPPKFPAIAGIHRGHTAPEGAATIIAVHRADDLGRRHRHIKTTVVQRRRTGDGACGMVLGRLFPDQLAAFCIERVNIGIEIAKIQPVDFSR